MGQPCSPLRAKYFVVALSADLSLFTIVREKLEKNFGEIEEETPPHIWNYSPAYTRELGGSIKRKFFVFKSLASPEDLPDWKLATNDLEQHFTNTRKVGNPRKLNLDPGYINDMQVIMASTKKYGNRVYLRNGIYADLTLYFNGRTFCPLSRMTFLDYKTIPIIKFFNRLRKDYLSQLNQYYEFDKQKERWQQEYLAKNTYTSTKAEKPSPALHILTNYFNRIGRIFDVKVLDVGCGVGRNSLFLAGQGAEIFGTDLIEDAIELFRAKAFELKLQDKIHLQVHDMIKDFPFQQETFDVVMDVTSSSNILKLSVFRRYIDRLAFLCKLGGCLFLATFDESDEYYKWLNEHCKEGYFIRDPNNNIASRFYTRDQIINAADTTNKLVLKCEEIVNASNIITGKKFKRAYK